MAPTLPAGGGDAAPASHSSARYAPLDGLRGLAIGLVLWHHLVEPYLRGGRHTWSSGLRAATGLSWCGVDLFFVLSGYFIGGILLDRRSSPRLMRTFYLRRAARILPLYYVALAAALAAVGSRYFSYSYHEFAPRTYGLFLTNLALARALVWDWLPLSVLWSLAVEEQFYLAAPWVVRWTPERLFPVLAVGLAAAAWLTRWLLLAFEPSFTFAGYVLMPARMDTLALGALVAWAVRRPAAAAFFDGLGRRWPRWVGLGALPIVVLAVLRPPFGAPALSLWGYGVLALFFALVVATVAGGRPPGLSRALGWKPLAHLGRHSYFVYLWHPLIGQFVIEHLGGRGFALRSVSGAAIVIAAVAAVWAAAILSMRVFEGPLIALGQRQRY